MVFFKGRKNKLFFKILQNRHHSWIGHIIRHEFVVNVLEGAILGKKTMTRMACNNPRWKAANQSKD
jgi:hypothetical protein